MKDASDAGHGHRRSLRLPEHDYNRSAAYYVTLCIQDRACLFGEVVDGMMRVNDAGRMGSDAWRAVTDRFPTIRLDAFVVMPNHIHGIVVITTTTATTVGAGLVPAHDDVPVTDRATTRVAPTLGDVIGAFKSITTVGYIRGVRTHRWPPFRGRLWQRNYYEHVIRDANSLDRIRRYILDNPRRWHQDRYNPTATRRSETPEREVPNVLREVAG